MNRGQPPKTVDRDEVGTAFPSPSWREPTIQDLAKRPAAAPDPKHPETCTVLAVDDDADVVELLHDILRGERYRVFTAESAVDALDFVDSYDGDVSLLVSDVLMPGMSGFALADALRRRVPQLPVVFVTGSTDDHVVRKALDARYAVYLPKPFEPTELLRRVRACLEETRRLVASANQR